MQLPDKTKMEGEIDPKPTLLLKLHINNSIYFVWLCILLFLSQFFDNMFKHPADSYLATDISFNVPFT